MAVDKKVDLLKIDQLNPSIPSQIPYVKAWAVEL